MGCRYLYLLQQLGICQILWTNNTLHMAATTLVRLLPLLLLLLPPALREYLTASHRPIDDAVAVGDLHPIVLVAGLGCSDVEARLTDAYRPSAPRCGAMKGKGWFGLCSNTSELLEHDYVRCFEEQMRLVYHPAINDYRNLPGVETRIPGFGSPRAFRDKNPLHPERCLDKVREALERVGYRDGDTLFGAPYDRPGPAIPILLALLPTVQGASGKHGKKVIVAAHSFGGMVAFEFVRSTPLAWRNKHIKHLIMAAPTLSAGFVQQVQNVVHGTSEVIYIPDTVASARTMWRSFETAVADLPSPAVFGREPVVITRRRNYSAFDMEDLLADIGFGDGVEPFRRRMVPKMSYPEAPMVPLTCINWVGIRTPRQLVFWEGDYDVSPEMVYGDGDGFVNRISMSAFDEAMRRQPGQREQFKTVKIPKVRHSEIVTEERAVNRVVQEILEANRN